NVFIDDLITNSFDDLPNSSDYLPQHQTHSFESNGDPPQHSDFRQLIGEMAMNTMLLSINLKSQRLDKEKQEVKNIVEQATKRKTRITESLQNFKIIHKMSFISNTPQISLVIAITPKLPTKEPEYSLSMGDEHLSSIPETKSNKVIKSSVKNLFPIPSESEEFSGELAHIDPIPSGIEEADFDLKEEIRFVENLLYDNSSPRPPEELNVEISDMSLESLSLSPILVEDSDSHMEEIYLFLATEFLSNDPLPLPEIESSNFDHHDDPSFTRPLLKPPDVEVIFDFEPDQGDLTCVVMNDIFDNSTRELYVFNVLPSQPTLCPNIDTFLPFLSENKDKVFKPGILSYLLVSHRDKIISDFFENPMMMYGGDIPLLDVLIAQVLEASRACGFVHRPLELQSLAYGNPIS
nr:hypothetical protein [Tanacetum cinerariifolium]